MVNSAENIAQILKRVIKKSHFSHKMNESTIKTEWERLVGREVARHTRPAFLKKTVLFVRVDSSAWAYELSTHLKDILLKKINEGVGEEVVGDIHFQVGQIIASERRS